MFEALKKNHRVKMEKVLADLLKAYEGIRTGRASVTLVDGMQIDAYGSKMPLIQLASVSTPDARTIAIQPFDAGQIPTIEKALVASDIGITPNNDGKIIRLIIPSLTEERRKDLVKTCNKYAEEHRIAVRKVRHHFNDEIKALEKAHEMSEDEMHRAKADEQKVTDEFIKRIEEETKKKEAEIMEV